MRKPFFLATALLAASLLPFTKAALSPVTKKRKLSDSLHPASGQVSTHSPIHLLPHDVLVCVFQHVQPEPLLSVCREWRHIILEHFKSCLGFLFNDADCFERHFGSEQERDVVIVKVIASDYAKVIEMMQLWEGDCAEPLSSELLEYIQSELAGNRLVKMLPTLSSSNPKTRLVNMLAGVGYFSDLPLVVRQFLAAKCIWKTTASADPKIGSLSSFLSSFHDQLDSFKNALLDVAPFTVQTACLEIVLGINGATLTVHDRTRLLNSISSLFPHIPSIGMACSLHDSMSSDSSISEIFNVAEPMCSSLRETLSIVLQSSPEHVTADWCIKTLKRPSLSLKHERIHYHLLFSGAFRAKHGISDTDQTAILQSCNNQLLLLTLPADLTGLDTQALVEWINANPGPFPCPWSCTVTLYSLDGKPNALEKYPRSLGGVDLSAFAKIALQVDYARHLTRAKMIALMQHLDPQNLAGLAAILDGEDRKALVAKIMSLFSDRIPSNLFDCISDSDFSLFVQAWLDGPGAYKVPSLSIRHMCLAARALVDCIGDDVDKVGDLKKFPEEYQIMVFLLTPHDAVADCLGEILGKKDLMPWFAGYLRHSGFASQAEAARAARRVHAHRQP